MNSDSHMDNLLRKYDVPVPRYTSYPTVPFWNVSSFQLDEWKSAVQRCFEETNESQGISVYIHLPFCESLCTYCACNTRITRNHNVEKPYLESVLREWEMYLKLFPTAPSIREIHLGGGTPTFFSPVHLEELLTGLLSTSTLHPEYEFSLEGHPNNTMREHLEVLYRLGFRRVSYGVQDLDPRVQKAIHRIQPFENLERATRDSREIGYHSVSNDIVYGLPFQTVESVEDTVKRMITLRPDRIAFYSYAHVPWLRPGQRGYEDADLPGDVEKRALYEAGRALFLEAGYLDIGMDHFALPHDSLAQAQEHGRLHRNFMGYTTTQSELLIGLGVSAISDAKYAYAQNEKKVEAYTSQVSAGEWAITKGHIQTDEDRLVRRAILDIACKGSLDRISLRQLLTPEVKQRLIELEEDGLIELTAEGLVVTTIGRNFIRNICSVFDIRMHQSGVKGENVFSRAV